MIRLMVGETTGAQVRSIVYALRSFHRIAVKQGVRGLVIYSKSSYVLLQQSLGGFKVPDTGELGCRVGRTIGGLPRIIPAESRERIRAGDISLIRIWLTLFSIYRVIEFPGKLKLNTITDPGKEIYSLLPEVMRFIPIFWSRTSCEVMDDELPFRQDRLVAKPWHISSTSPLSGLYDEEAFGGFQDKILKASSGRETVADSAKALLSSTI